MEDKIIFADGVENELLEDVNTCNNEENPDENSFFEFENKHKNERDIAKHGIAMNIYDFFRFITKKSVLIFLIILFIFIIYPLSKMNLVIYSFSVSEYFTYIHSATQNFFALLVGVILSDWASSKYKK